MEIKNGPFKIHVPIFSTRGTKTKFLVYPFESVQQVPCSSERSPLCAYGSGDDITVMSQLVATLNDEGQGIVVVGSQLMAVQDHHLGASHLVLTRTEWISEHVKHLFTVLHQGRLD